VRFARPSSRALDFPFPRRKLHNRHAHRVLLINADHPRPRNGGRFSRRRSETKQCIARARARARENVVNACRAETRRGRGARDISASWRISHIAFYAPGPPGVLLQRILA